MVIQVLTTDFWKQMKLNCGAERHHYSMFNVGRSTFIFQNNPARHRCTTRMFTKQPSAYGTPQPVARSMIKVPTSICLYPLLAGKFKPPARRAVQGMVVDLFVVI
jgi:hypothetical protein